jgi:uncharacterized small protein (DUF1192 family)
LDDVAEPRRQRGAELALVLKEDLDGYAVVDLQDRIAQLQAEIERVQAALHRKNSGRAAADALFSGFS